MQIEHGRRKMKKLRTLNLQDVTTIGVLAAMCVIATSLKIPFGNGAMVHLGTGFLFTVALLFGGVYGGLTGAIGSAFFDLLLGFSPYTLWSFFIKGMAGLIVGTVAQGLWPKAGGLKAVSRLRALMACLLGATWTLGGYMLAWTQVMGSFGVALSNAPSSLMTSGVGIPLALLAAPALRKALGRSGVSLGKPGGLGAR